MPLERVKNFTGYLFNNSWFVWYSCPFFTTTDRVGNIDYQNLVEIPAKLIETPVISRASGEVKHFQ